MSHVRERLTALLHRTHHHAAVHFHRGPHGDPTPCFDDHCPAPRL